MDALIAEKVFGCRWILNPCKKKERILVTPDESHKVAFHRQGFEVGYMMPHYSTSIAAAWEVVEHWYRTHERTMHLGIRIFGEPDHYSVQLDDHIDMKFEAEAATLPHAICLAALKAVT